MGTITKYYPFIDEKSQSILNSLMDESSSYNDFVQTFCGVVVENEVSLDLVFIAAVQAWWTRTEESVKLIQEKYKDEPCIRPWGYVIKSSVSDQARYHDSVVAAIDKALDTTLADWMEVELHFIHSYLHYPTFGDVPSLLEPLKKAKGLIDSNHRLMCFQPLILMFEGCVQGMEEYRKDSIDTHKRGLELARNNDDKLYTYLNLEPLAGAMVNFDVQESLDLFQEMYDLAQDLDVPYMIGEALYDASIAFGFAGEYDLQISSIEECIKILGGDDSDWMELSWAYAELGDGQMALEWANQAFENVGHIEYPRLYLAKAWALALLNRVEEAEHNLGTAYSLILKTGKEYPLGIYYHVAGVIELARGDYEAALDLLEKSEEIIERMAVALYQNNVLLDLARVEILLAGKSKGSTIGITPGKWLSKLERHALERNLPGIRMQAAMLKSEFYQNNGQLRDAHATLQEALNITDSLGVKTLRKKIHERIRELNQLLREVELSSKKRKEQGP
jgi:tetratricopeptide (TPR) repeat protein